LDEGVSGDAFASLLTQGRIPVQPFESLLRKNAKTPDAAVIERSAKANLVLVTTDKRMESDWTDDIILHRAKVLLLADEDGGPIHWAAALLCGQAAWTRVLLDHPRSPVTIRVDRAGHVRKVVGETDLRQRRDQLVTSRIARAKRHGAGHGTREQV
jgi:hypothetical protein